MTFRFNFIIAAMLAAFLSTLAAPVFEDATVPAARSVKDVSQRSTATCADPSLARVVTEWFAGSTIAHNLQFHWFFVNRDSTEPAGPAMWTFQGDGFKAWPTQQPFTVPLFRLINTAQTDFIFATGVDAKTPPVVSGFTTVDISAWVYNDTVCDSVPLLTAVLASQTDHYYTTDAEQHAELLNAGWTDGGVAAFVLPLSSS